MLAPRRLMARLSPRRFAPPVAANASTLVARPSFTDPTINDMAQAVRRLPAGRDFEASSCPTVAHGEALAPATALFQHRSEQGEILGTACGKSPALARALARRWLVPAPAPASRPRFRSATKAL